MRQRRGFTLLEALIVTSLVGVVVIKVCLLMRMRSTTQSSEITAMTVEDQARRVMEQIAFALMGADRDRVTPDPESPNYSSEVRFEVRMGVENGEVVWGDPQWMGITDAERQVAWRERPDEPDGRRVVWCNVVRPFLEGELMNGIDDNGNGLVDEKGLTFALEDELVTIRLTLERADESGHSVQRSVEMAVALRNGGGD